MKEFEKKLKKLKKLGFDIGQRSEIERGMENGVDVGVYTDLKFDGQQMQQIRWGLEKGLNVAKFADPKYDSRQMEQIMWSLERGIDITNFADPKFSGDQMKEIAYGVRCGLDITNYANPKYNWRQMEQIRRALERGYDVSRILDTSLTCSKIENILKKENPSIEQFLKNFNIENDGKKAILYKAVRKLNETTFCSYFESSFVYKIDKIAFEPDINWNKYKNCTTGIHLSSLAWVKNYVRGTFYKNPAFIEVEVDIADIILPANTNGQVRVSLAKVLREVF